MRHGNLRLGTGERRFVEDVLVGDVAPGAHETTDATECLVGACLVQQYETTVCEVERVLPFGSLEGVDVRLDELDVLQADRIEHAPSDRERVLALVDASHEAGLADDLR